MLVNVHLLRSTIALFLFAFPFFTFAEGITTWDFADAMHQDAIVHQLTDARVTNSGLSIQTSSDGFIQWGDSPIPGPADVVTLRVKSADQVESALLWPQDKTDDAELLQLFFTIPQSDDFIDVDVIVSDYDQWDHTAENFGIAFPAGANVVIEKVMFRHWPLHERIVEGWKSYWHFDAFRPYSINFLWGPLIVTNSPAREQLYENLPPHAWSANRIYYVLIAVAGMIAYGLWRFGKSDRRANQALLILGGTCVSLWLIFDARMGMEMLAYAKRDIATYVLAPDSDAKLRTHGDFYATVKQMTPFLMEHGRYGLITIPGTPYFANLRYITYPSIPITMEKDTSGIRLWAVIERGDVTMGAQRRLIDDSGSPLTPPGSIILPINDKNFLFLADE